MTSVELGLGFGFGLFAIFSVLRYRTDEMPIREMTYLFVIIGLSVMNSFVTTPADISALLIANALMAAVLFAIERSWGFRFEVALPVVYERIKLISPSQRERLVADLRERTGLPIERVEVKSVDFVRDTAHLRVFYREAVHPVKHQSVTPPTGHYLNRTAPFRGPIPVETHHTS